MNILSRVFSVVLLSLLFIDASAQDVHERMNKMLAEVDENVIQINISKIADETIAIINNYNIRSVAILPFRDVQNKRTGLTEFITKEFEEKISWNETINFIPSDQVESLLKNQFSLATLNWTKDCERVSSHLGVAALLRGRLIYGNQEFGLDVEVYGADMHQVLGRQRTHLPRTAGLSRLVDLVLEEKPSSKEKAPPRPQDTPTPKYKPQPEKPVSQFTVPTTIEIAVGNLADKLIAYLPETNQLKVGVLEFLDLSGRITQLGKFIGEDLTTAIFEKRRFSMVERGLLQQVMREQALTQTGIIDITQAQEIGKLVGAKAIITGSLSDIGNEIKANARLIDIGSGTLLAVAGASIAKTENVAKMFNIILWPLDSKKRTPPEPTEKMPPSVPDGYIFFEDFQEVPEGMLPEGWLGGEKLMVKSDGRQRFVTDFERQRSHKLLIDNLSFPENFEFTMIFQYGGDASGTHLFAYVGSLMLTIDVFGWYRLNNTQVEKRMDWRHKVVKAVLTKNGPIFKLFINGEEVILIRDTTYKLPQAVSLEFQNMSGFKLMEVYLRAL